jgi:N-acetylneuraminic acid mutarotase
LLAEPSTIASGATSTLRWSVLRATACTLNGAAVAADNGTFATGALSSTTRYTLACSNATSTDSRVVDVTVLPVVAAGWTRLADMPVALAKFGVAEINGQLVVAGGYDTLTTVYLYDIATDQWRPGPSLPRGSDNLGVVTAGGRVYALGGEARNAVQVYDPTANAWSSGPAIPAIRFASAAGVIDGRIHIAGGWNYNNVTTGSLATQDVFDTATQTWAAAGTAAAMPTARNAAGGAAIDGRFYVAGGRAPGIRSNDNTPLAALEVYTPATNSWTAGPGAPTARGSVAAAALGGRLYVFGGEAGAAGVTDAVERYDVARGVWEALPPMPYRAHGQGAVAAGSAIYVMGGFTGPSDAVGTASRALYRYVPSN